jgi:hypothetical protein
VFTLSKKSLIDVPTVLLYVATVAATLAFSLSPLMVIPAAILYGLVVQRLKRRKP